jgi:hypothetical protein
MDTPYVYTAIAFSHTITTYIVRVSVENFAVYGWALASQDSSEELVNRLNYNAVCQTCRLRGLIETPGLLPIPPDQTDK